MCIQLGPQTHNPEDQVSPVQARAGGRENAYQAEEQRGSDKEVQGANSGSRSTVCPSSPLLYHVHTDRLSDVFTGWHIDCLMH